MFNKGDKVVCVNDSFDAMQQVHIPNLPNKDEIYTVRDCFVVTRNGTVSGIPAVHLNEIRNPNIPHPNGMGTYEPNFAASRFALAQDNKVKEKVEELEEAL